MGFQYLVRDPLGKIHEGLVEAATREAAQQSLVRDGFQILKLEQDDGGNLFPRRIKRSDIIYATSQLAIMVETGITLSVALASIAEQEENPTLKEVLQDLKNRVEAGEDFSVALARHPRHFDKTYVALVRAS